MVEPNIEEFHKSLGEELLVVQNRVRNLIGSVHWGEEGRYKEILVQNFLRKYLPEDIGIGTGFIIAPDNTCSHQIDIILYQKSGKLYFKEGDFIICPPKPVLGIIEVKTTLKSDTLAETIQKSTFNAMLVNMTQERNPKEHYRDFFNGVFSFNDFDGDIANSLTAAMDNCNLRVINSLPIGSEHYNEVKKISGVDIFQFINNSIIIKRNDGYYQYDLKDVAISAFAAVLTKTIGIHLSESEINKVFPQFSGNSRLIYKYQK